MLEIHILRQFDIRIDDAPIEIPSRPAQSLLAYLVLNAGISHRRERLAGLFWPDSTEANARSYLRMALWRIRKSLEAGSVSWNDYLRINEISVTFDEGAVYWSDADAVLERKDAGDWSVEELTQVVSGYRDELLPGFLTLRSYNHAGCVCFSGDGKFSWRKNRDSQPLDER